MSTGLHTTESDQTIDLEGDHLNAHRFLRDYGTRVKWSPELGSWFVWTGSWWELDTLEQVPQLASETIDNLRKWVGEAADPSEAQKRVKHYKQSCGAGRRDGLLKLARTDPGIVVAIDDLDSYPMTLACLNGVVNLETGTISPSHPELLITRGVRVHYDATAHSDEWDGFLETIFKGDAELVSFVHRLLGYCITGLTIEHVLPILWGTGANGKSTLIGVLQDLLGELATTAPEGLLTTHNHQPHPERLAALRGRRLVVSHELEQQAVLAEQTVKALTGGDLVSARELYGKRFDYMPTHKLVVCSNHTPKVRGTDHAIWRRLRLIPFNVTIPPERQDAHLRERLVREHGSAIVTWLVQGAVAWNRHGLGDAPAVREATASYRERQDIVDQFLRECTVPVESARTKVGVLFAQWRQWGERLGERPGRMQDFSDALVEHDVRVQTYRGQNYALGIGLRSCE